MLKTLPSEDADVLAAAEEDAEAEAAGAEAEAEAAGAEAEAEALAAEVAVLLAQPETIARTMIMTRIREITFFISFPP